MRHVPDPNADDVRTLAPILAIVLLLVGLAGAFVLVTSGPIAVTATAHDDVERVPYEVNDVSEFEPGHPVREAAVAAHERNESVTVNGTITDRSKVQINYDHDAATLYVRVDGEVLAVEVEKRE
jgi:hypothetical protein